MKFIDRFKLAFASDANINEVLQRYAEDFLKWQRCPHLGKSSARRMPKAAMKYSGSVCL